MKPERIKGIIEGYKRVLLMIDTIDPDQTNSLLQSLADRLMLSIDLYDKILTAHDGVSNFKNSNPNLEENADIEDFECDIKC